MDEFVKIVDNYCFEKGYSLKLGRIYANVPKDIVRKALKKGVVTPCGVVPDLTPDEIDLAVRIIAQMGHEPLVDLMEKYPGYDIVISGRTYDPSGHALYCINQGITNWGTAYHMGKVMECGAQCSWPKSKEALATIWDDRFDILPLQTFSKCSPQSLAAHSLYQNPNTELHYGPGGVLDLKLSSYKTIGPRSAGAMGTIFHKTPYCVKLEGSKVGENRTIWIGSFRDPVLISQIDDFQVRLKEHLYTKFPQHKFEVVTKAYGKDGTMGPLETDTSVAKEIFLLGEVMHEDQITATQIANVGRVFCVHDPYKGQVSTTGNYAMPLPNLEIPLGRKCSFNIYILPVKDPLSLFPSSVQTVGPNKSTATRNPEFGFDLIQPNPEATGTCTNGVARSRIERQARPRRDARHQDRKEHPFQNVGPYEITFDIIFNDLAAYNFAKGSPKLTAEYLVPLWSSSPKDIIGCQFSEPACAFKFTLPRPWGAGGFGERDLHCSQQHVPLLNLVL